MIKINSIYCVLLSSLISACSTSPMHSAKFHCESDRSLPSINSPTVKLISLNAAHGRKKSFNQLLVSKKKIVLNLKDIAQAIHASKADIVALQEVDGPSFWSGNFDHVSFLRNKAGYNCSAHGHHINAKFLNYGAAILSTAKAQSFQSVRFEPSPPTTRKGFVKTVINWQPHDRVIPLTVISVHLDFASKSTRTKQITTLFENLKDINTPVVIMGDFNSYWQQNPSHVRMLADNLGLTAFASESETLSTFKHLKERRLDWILISKELKFVNYQNGIEELSDHKSVFAEIAYKPSVFSGIINESY